MCSVYFLPRLVALQCVYVMCLRLIKYIRYLVQFTLSVSAFPLYFLLLLWPAQLFKVPNRVHVSDAKSEDTAAAAALAAEEKA